MKQSSIIWECNILVTLIRVLSTNRNRENTIQKDHFKIDTRENDIALILLIRFIS